MTCRPKPLDTDLYEKVKKRVKKRVRRWPSAYASGLVVQEYKAAGGRYDKSCPRSKGGLTKWFKERWVNVCEPELPACGRPKAGEGERAYRKRYPKCRPLKQAKAMSKKQRTAACRRKRRAVQKQPARSTKVVWVD